ncbi:hypothetical protein GCM10011517_12470 [Actibacterium pelagium]|uniref:Uncharacterized protein n=1 Tax=Actibacterium pelagium TaxID=2029103 RepID=A0A917AEX4_9RHOB|nr:hypothetical protein GCM10011517_12470 [Actibacterium pelagium]
MGSDHEIGHLVSSEFGSEMPTQGSGERRRLGSTKENKNKRSVNVVEIGINEMGRDL